MNQVEPITTDELRRRKAEMDRGGWPECASFLAYIRDHFEEICAAIDAADADRLDAIEQRMRSGQKLSYCDHSEMFFLTEDEAYKTLREAADAAKKEQR